MVPVPAVLADDFIRIRPCLGVLVPEQNCESTPPAYVNFERENAHYVSRLLVNWEDDVQELSLSDPRSRGYRATIEVDTTIDWIKSQPADQPWMATLSFSSAHTPLQHPPRSLVPSGAADILTADCSSAAPLNQRNIMDTMVEALDTELGRLLVETGIASRGDDGSLIYDPAASNRCGERPLRVQWQLLFPHAHVRPGVRGQQRGLVGAGSQCRRERGAQGSRPLLAGQPGSVRGPGW